LVEFILVITLVIVLSGISIPLYRSFQMRNELEVAANTLVFSLRQAQILAHAVADDNNWGIKIMVGQIIVFRGANFVSRTVADDISYDLPQAVTPTGMGEVVFNKFLGEPQVAGSIILTSNTNETRTITINSKGMVSF